MTELDSMIAEIESEKLLSKAAFQSVDLDGVLDSRDKDPFDSNWVESHQRVEAAWSANSTDEQTAKVNKVRQAAFVAASSMTNHHEIASYISDDFELIAKSVVLGDLDSFTSRLFERYRRGEVPS